MSPSQVPQPIAFSFPSTGRPSTLAPLERVTIHRFFANYTKVCLSHYRIDLAYGTSRRGHLHCHLWRKDSP